MRLHSLANHDRTLQRLGDGERHGIDDKRLSLDGDKQRRVAVH